LSSEGGAILLYDYAKSSRLRDSLYEYLEAARLVRMNHDMKILDIGCGLHPLKHVYPDVMGIDLARNSHADVLADALHLPFRDNYFDAVISVELLEHLPNGIALMKEMKRVSKKYVLISTANKFTGKYDHRHIHEYSLFKLKKLFKKVGLKILDFGFGGLKRFPRIVQYFLPFWLWSEWIMVLGEK